MLLKSSIWIATFTGKCVWSRSVTIEFLFKKHTGQRRAWMLLPQGYVWQINNHFVWLSWLIKRGSWVTRLSKAIQLPCCTNAMFCSSSLVTLWSNGYPVLYLQDRCAIIFCNKSRQIPTLHYTVAVIKWQFFYIYLKHKLSFNIDSVGSDVRNISLCVGMYLKNKMLYW